MGVTGAAERSRTNRRWFSWRHEPNTSSNDGEGRVDPRQRPALYRQVKRSLSCFLFFYLFSRDLCPLPGDGVFHGFKLLQQLLAAGQCVAGFVGARARAGA